MGTKWDENNTPHWCNENFLDSKILRKSKEVREQLLDIMKQCKMHISSCGYEWEAVRKSLCTAYIKNAAKIKGKDKYVNCHSGIPAYIHPTSALYYLGYMPEYVVYQEVVMTHKEYMQVTAVEP